MHLTTLDTYKCNHTVFVLLSLVYYANMTFKTNPGRWEEREGEGRGQIHLYLFLVLAVKEVPWSALLGQTAVGSMHYAAEMVLLAE